MMEDNFLFLIQQKNQFLKGDFSYSLVRQTVWGACGDEKDADQ
jgi:hypothetical protein